MDVVKLRQRMNQPYRLMETSDGLQLLLRMWEAGKKSSTAVLIFHGITAHSKPYEFIAAPIAAAGMDAYGLDLRGHGLSDGPRGDCGSLDQVKNDLRLVVSTLAKDYENVVLLGHSLGIITSVFALEQCYDLVDGVILLSGARRVREEAYPERSTLTKLKYLFWSIVRPSKPIIHYFREGMQGLDDPLFTFHYTLRFLRTYSASNIVIPREMRQPLLMGIGDQDELFSVDSAKELFEEFPSDDAEFLIIEGAKHAEFPEDVGESRIIGWLIEKFGT